jgi:hypothetical protein
MTADHYGEHQAAVRASAAGKTTSKVRPKKARRRTLWPDADADGEFAKQLVDRFASEDGARQCPRSV